jgi:signal transduction histidine kinase
MAQSDKQGSTAGSRPGIQSKFSLGADRTPYGGDAIARDGASLRETGCEHPDRDELRESELTYRKLAQIGSDWIWETDDQFRLISNTRHKSEVADFLTNIEGMTHWQLAGADPDGDPEWHAHRADLKAHRPFRDFRFSFLPPARQENHYRVSGSHDFNNAGQLIGYLSTNKNDGGRIHVSISGFPVFGEYDVFLGYRGTAREITSRVVAEELASQAHQRLLDAIEALPESFILCDAEDRIVLCNSATRTKMPWCNILTEPGMKFEDRLSDLVFSGTVPNAIGREEEWIRERMEQHRNDPGIHEMKRGDGRWVQITERRTADGGTVLIHADITKQKRDELEREAALTRATEENRAKSTFLANLTHELRDPLTAILSAVGQLSDVPNPSQNVQRQKKSIRDATRHLLALVNNALDISRIDVGKYTVEPSIIDIAAIIRECSSAVWEDEANAEPALILALPDDLASVYADGQTSRQIFMNILGDACRSAPPDCTVRISARNMDDYVEIAVEDNGPGPSDADVGFLMHPFDRPGNADDPLGHACWNGIGLRLTAADAMARHLGGLLSVTTPADGGTIVTVRLPRPIDDQGVD